MRTGLTKQEKTTDIWFDEKGLLIHIRTHNTVLKNRLTAYAAIDRLRCAQRMLTNTDFIDADIQALEEDLTTITGMLRLCITENAANATTEEAYRTTHADLCRRFEETEAKLAALQKQRDKMKADAIAIGGMMFELGELDALPVDFDEKLWNGTIDHVTVQADERVVFVFKDKAEITTTL